MKQESSNGFVGVLVALPGEGATTIAVGMV